MGVQSKCLYVFNIEGDIIERTTVNKFIIKNKLNKHTVRRAIFRESIINRRFYVSFNAEFKIPRHKKDFNPLLSGGHCGPLLPYLDLNDF